MPITAGTMSEEERWAAAARMLEIYGDDAGDVLIAKVEQLIVDGEQALAREWFDICDKANQLYDPDGGA